MATATRPARKLDRSIVEGPLPRAVWKLAWPTMLQNIIGGAQGVVDHALVGHFVGYAGNAAIGVAFQIFLVVMVFVSSLFTGMGVLVSRFAGAGDHEQVNRTVYQAFIAAIGLSVCILAPAGYFLAPYLLDIVHAAPAVKVEALPYIRIMFLGSFGMMMFFMMGGALRSAGDARTPLMLGILLTILNIGFNIVLITGAGPFPKMGTAGAALGMSIAGLIVTLISVALLLSGRLPVHWHKGMSKKPDWVIIRQLFKFGLPSGFQGVVMNIGGVLLLRFIGSMPESGQAQAAYAIGYTELFSFVTWTSVGIMGATAAVAGQNLGAGRPDRTARALPVAAGIGLSMAAVFGLLFVLIPRQLLAAFGMTDPEVVRLGVQLLRVLSVSGLFITVALAYTGGLQGTGDTKSPFYISLVSQVLVPIGICGAFQAAGHLTPMVIWLAIPAGHATRCLLSVLRFRQEKWRNIRIERAPA
ncbi:MAG TPA: MATE family efflux transporter [Gemmatimonadales bacterium]|jgi:putative MATE family efflux protein|nr:MATE family efflux transporter [Gemmatimonadales bacterium]